MSSTAQSINPVPPASISSGLVPSDARISSQSVFTDMVWDRREFAESRTTWKGAILRWELMFERYSSTHYGFLISLMEFAYALLFDPHAEDRQRDTKTVLENIKCFDNFLAFLQERHLYNVADLEQSHMHEYLAWLLRQRESSQHKILDTHHNAILWASHRIRAIQLYYKYGKKVSQPLTVNPLHGKGLFRHLGHKRRSESENRTPIIPKEIWDPLLSAALDYVEFYATDILKGQEMLERCRAEILPTAMEQRNFTKLKYVEVHLNPVLKSLTNFSINPKTRSVWRVNWNSSDELLAEMRALHDACSLTIAGLSGMRESELSFIEVGGCSVDSATDGASLRYRIESRVIKGDSNKNYYWEVNEPVYRACNVLERLTSYARSHIGIKNLFIQAWDLAPSKRYSSKIREIKTGLSFRKEDIAPIGPCAFSSNLRRFAEHFTSALEGQYRLPNVNGKPWVLVTRMLRRSLAGRIAREPFGTIAGMLQYKHLKITTFLGYAGSNDNWLQELHDEELAATDEFLQQIWEDLNDGALAGGKGEELLKDFAGMAGDLKKNALQYFLENNRTNLHVGLFNYCIFQKDRALCLMNSKLSEENTPILNSCHPDRCANSCITSKHLPQWEVQMNDAHAMLRQKNISEPQRIALSRDMEKVHRIVGGLKKHYD